MKQQTRHLKENAENETAASCLHSRCTGLLFV